MKGGFSARGPAVAGLVGVVMALAGVAPATGTDFQWVRTVSNYGPDGTSTFNSAQSVTVDPSGNVWATNLHGYLVKFDGSGNWLGTFGQSVFSGEDGLHSDSSGNIWVARGGAIAEFDSSGSLLKQLLLRDYPGGVLQSASDVAVDPSGNIWVTEFAHDNFGLDKFSSNGALLGRYGPPASGSSGQLNGPCGLTIDASGNVWVSDTDNSRIVEFANDGTTVRQQFGSPGSGNGQLFGAEGIALDGAGNLWVADEANNRIEEFSSTGAYLGQFGTYGTGPGQIAGPQGLAFDAAGNLWVADTDNNRLQEFSPVPEPSALVLFGIGAGSLLAYAWRRRRVA